MIFLVANFSDISSTIPGYDMTFKILFLRILIYISIIAIITVVIDVFSIREIVYFLVKKIDSDSIAINIGVGKIIELDPKKIKNIHRANIIIGVIEFVSSIFIFFIALLVFTNVLNIENLLVSNVQLSQIASESMFIFALLFLGITLNLSGLILFYINREQISLGM